MQIMELSRKEGRIGKETLLNVQCNGCDKAAALEDLCTRVLDCTAADAMVFGNDFNDTGMFKWAGHCVCMSDAPPEVLRIAKEVAPTVKEDGVAVVLERVLSGLEEAAAGKARL